MSSRHPTISCRNRTETRKGYKIFFASDLSDGDIGCSYSLGHPLSESDPEQIKRDMEQLDLDRNIYFSMSRDDINKRIELRGLKMIRSHSDSWRRTVNSVEQANARAIGAQVHATANNLLASHGSQIPGLQSQ